MLKGVAVGGSALDFYWRFLMKNSRTERSPSSAKRQIKTLPMMLVHVSFKILLNKFVNISCQMYLFLMCICVQTHTDTESVFHIYFLNETHIKLCFSLVLSSWKSKIILNCFNLWLLVLFSPSFGFMYFYFIVFTSICSALCVHYKQMQIFWKLQGNQ